MTNQAVSFLPAITEDKKMEVFLDGDEAVLKFSTWTENLGWNCQKTVRFDASMLEDLHRSITAARYKLNRQNAESEEKPARNVIKFPIAA